MCAFTPENALSRKFHQYKRTCECIRPIVSLLSQRQHALTVLPHAELSPQLALTSCRQCQHDPEPKNTSQVCLGRCHGLRSVKFTRLANLSHAGPVTFGQAHVCARPSRTKQGTQPSHTRLRGGSATGNTDPCPVPSSQRNGAAAVSTSPQIVGSPALARTLICHLHCCAGSCMPRQQRPQRHAPLSHHASDV